MQRLALTILAVLLLSPLTASAATHVVTQVGSTFDPDFLLIEPGDTVEWHWTSLAHTVTSGYGSADPESGSLFNYTLYSVVPVVSYTFNTLGFYDYYCIPHESMGMTGTILVEAPVATEPATWGRIKKLFQSSSVSARPASALER